MPTDVTRRGRPVESAVRNRRHSGRDVIKVTPNDVEEVYALRAALDRLAAVSARAAASAEQLTELDDLVGAMENEVHGEASGPRLLALDIAFHDRIYEIAANGRLSRAWQAVRSQVYLFQLRRIALGYQHYSARVVDEHRELSALLRAGDAETLGRAAQEHVDSARRSLLADLPE